MSLMNVSKVGALILALGLFSGCATTTAVQHAQETADSALAAAKEASAKADAAQASANECKATCDRVNSKMDRMFMKSQAK